MRFEGHGGLPARATAEVFRQRGALADGEHPSFRPGVFDDCCAVASSENVVVVGQLEGGAECEEAVGRAGHAGRGEPRCGGGFGCQQACVRCDPRAVFECEIVGTDGGDALAFYEGDVAFGEGRDGEAARAGGVACE